MRYNRRVESLEDSPIRVMMARTEQMEDVISFAVGQPDFKPEKRIMDAAKASLDRGETGYAPGEGLLELRKAYAEYLSDAIGTAYNADEVVVTAGGMSSLYVAFMCLLEPGDEVLLPSPYWTNYAQQITLCGGRPVPVEVREEDEFVVTPKGLRAALTDRTKVILLNSPCNPTGGVISDAALEEIAQMARERDLFVISDEVYRHILFGGLKYTSIASLKGMKSRTLVVDSCSKSFAMPGFRVGFAAGPQRLIELMVKIAEDVYACGATCCQYAALEAFRCGTEYRDSMVREYERRCEFIYRRVNAIEGLSCIRPKGAFYVFVNISGTGLKAPEFCDRLLEEERVAMVPGDTFGTDADHYVRVSYAISMEEIVEGMNRTERFVRRLRDEAK